MRGAAWKERREEAEGGGPEEGASERRGESGRVGEAGGVPTRETDLEGEGVVDVELVEGRERVSSLMWMMTTARPRRGQSQPTLLKHGVKGLHDAKHSLVTPANGSFVASNGLHPAEMRTSSTNLASTVSSSNMNGGDRWPQSLSVGCEVWMEPRSSATSQLKRSMAPFSLRLKPTSRLDVRGMSIRGR